MGRSLSPSQRPVSDIYINIKRNVWPTSLKDLMQCVCVGGVAPHEALCKGQRAARPHWLDLEPATQLRGARAESSASVGVLILFVTVAARHRSHQPSEHAEIVQN